MIKSIYRKSGSLGIKLMTLAAFLLMAPVAIRAQGGAGPITVSGTVVNESGSPVTGVSVRVSGGNRGTTTNQNGGFTIESPADGTLVFTFLGMATQEVPVNGRTNLLVEMENESLSISDVVVIGYGTQSRATVTNSISRVNEEEFLRAPGQNPLVQLQGKVAGLNLMVTSGEPGHNPSMFIRGGTTTSPTGDTPLIIVDGIVSQGMRSIQDMNPSDIESLQVLKDAASTAIYGAKAANGIIIVKTKNGQKGKARVNFQYTYGIEEKPARLDLMNAREYVYMTRRNTMMFNTTDPDKFLSGSWGMSTSNPRNSANTLAFLDEYLNNYGQDYVNNLLVNEGWETMADPVTGQQLIFQNNDYQDATFRTGHKHKMDIDISGGTDNGSYYFGMGYLNQDGTLRGNNYRNYNFLFNGFFNLSDKWSVNTKATLQVRDVNGPGITENTISRGILMPPTYRIYYEDGTPAPGEGIGSFRSRVHEVYYKTRYNDQEVYRTSFQMGANWDILDGLSFTPTLYYFMAEGIQNYFEADNPATGTTTRPASANHDFDRHIQADALLAYNKEVAPRHTLNAVAGGSYNHDYSYRMNGSGSGSLIDQIPTLNATADSTQLVSTTKSAEAMLSWFGRVNYDYDKRYMLSVSLRMDGSSRFSQNHKWATFPGVSAGWNMHRESFFAPALPVVSKFKLRTSWGKTGNNNITMANSHGRYAIVGNNYDGKVGILNTVLPNADLVWETTTSFDMGLDLGLLGDRLVILADYYDKLTSDRLFDQPLWHSTGFGSIKSNYGTIRNRGVEIEINATPVRSKNFRWDISATFSFNRSVVEKLPENEHDRNRVGGNTIYDPVTGQDVKVGGIAEGERFGGRWAFNFLGIYQTDEEAAGAPSDPNAKNRVKVAGDSWFEDRNGDGILDAKDMVFMGYVMPDKMGGLVNTFGYKSLTVRVVIDWAAGHVIDNGFKANMMGSVRNNNNGLREAMWNSWEYEGHTAKYPKYTVQSDIDYDWRNHKRWDNQIGSTDGASNNSLYYGKGDYLAFREVSATYTFRGAWVGRAGLSALEIFAGVYNIGYITAYDGLTPEIFDGTDYGTYPRPRQYNMGVRISF